MKKIFLPAALLLSICIAACDNNGNSATTSDTTIIEKEKTIVREKEVQVEKTATQPEEEPSTSIKIGKDGLNVKSRKTTVVFGKDSANLQIRKP